MTEDTSQPLFQMGEQREKSFHFICYNVTLQMSLLAFPTHQTFNFIMNREAEMIAAGVRGQPFL